MDVWFSNRRGTTAERHERELKHLRILCTRFSEARQESFCPLDTDLSWMSGSQSMRKHPREPPKRTHPPKNFMHAVIRRSSRNVFPHLRALGRDAGEPYLGCRESLPWD